MNPRLASLALLLSIVLAPLAWPKRLTRRPKTWSTPKSTAWVCCWTSSSRPAKSNGLGIVDVASGAYYSDRGKINDHKRAQMFDIFCGKGYTVFAVRPGSRTRFSLADMAANVRRGIEWVKKHADQYQIDPQRLGLTGASAGGHLASLVAVTADDKTAVKAVGVFFPPTDFLEYRGKKIDFATASEGELDALAKVRLAARRRANRRRRTGKEADRDQPRAAGDQQGPAVSDHPRRRRHDGPLVAIGKAAGRAERRGVPCELIVKKGGGHPWPTIHEEVQVMADWFDKQLDAH